MLSTALKFTRLSDLGSNLDNWYSQSLHKRLLSLLISWFLHQSHGARHCGLWSLCFVKLCSPCSLSQCLWHSCDLLALVFLPEWVRPLVLSRFPCLPGPSPFIWCQFFWVWHKHMRCPLQPLRAYPISPPAILVRLRHCEATHLFIWILWISIWPVFGWNLDSTVTFQPSSPPSPVLLFCENDSEQSQFWTGPEEMGQELCGQEGGVRAVGELKVNFFQHFLY